MCEVQESFNILVRRREAAGRFNLTSEVSGRESKNASLPADER